MQVLGVDQSFTMTGLARVDELGLISLARVATSAQGAGGGTRGTRDRIRYIVGQTLRFAPAEVLTVIEAPIVARGGKGGAQLERAMLFGLLVDQLLSRGEVVVVHPATRAKYAAGAGHASKEQVLTAMRGRFPGLRFRDDNEADAAALACMGARWLGRPVDGAVGRKQEEAMTSVVWPERGSVR